MKRARYVRKKPNKKLSVVLAFLIVILGLLVMLVNFITDWMWFSEMSYVDVFFKGLYTQIKIFIPIFIIVVLMLEYYLHRLRNDYFKNIESHEVTDMKRLKLLTNVMAFAFSAVMSFYAANRLWFRTLEYIKQRDRKSVV